MGTRKKLLAFLSKAKLPDTPTGYGTGKSGAPTMEKLLKDGFDPTHAAYIFIQNIAAYFAEVLSPLPEMAKYAQIVGKAEEEYMPSGPPMSPLTTSFFTSWALFDLRFDGTDTIADCLIESRDPVGMTPDQVDALRIMATSRMGIYENLGMKGSHIRLRDIITEAECTCHNPTGYRGRTGELWYTRILPPLVPEYFPYHISFTTPYILLTRKEDWLQFFRRTLLQPGLSKSKKGIERFLKYGPDIHYWNEYVLKAYVNHQEDAIFLTGIPDLKATLPHA